MKILAIDPGNKNSAWVILDGLTIVGHGYGPNEELLLSPADDVTLVVEMVQSFGMAVGKEVFETVFWIGRFCQMWEPFKWDRIYRGEVKMHLCRSMRAKDGNIRQALIDKLGPQGVKKAPGPTYGISGDMWSALAVGVVYAETKASIPAPSGA